MSGNDDWIDWGGGECPVADLTLVRAWFRNDELPSNDIVRAEDYYWKHDGDEYDIIKYRIVREAAQ